MNRLSVLKIVTLVLFLVVGGVARAAGETEKSCRAKNMNFEDAGTYDLPTGATRNQPARCVPDPQFDERRKECKRGFEDLEKASGKLTRVCKEKELGGQKDMNSVDKAIKACQEILQSCGTISDEEKSFSQVAGSLGSLTGMAGIPGMLPSSSGSCSKYTQDKLDSLIREQKRDIKDVNRELKESKEKQVKDEESYEDKKKKISEEFLTQQEEKAEAELKSGEDQATQQATYNKQRQEYEAKIREQASTIATLQQQQKLLIEKRRIDVASYKGMVLTARQKCIVQVKKQFAGPSGVGSFGSAQASMRDKQDAYAACMDEFTNQRTMDAENFSAAMAELDRRISDRAAEQQATRTSLDNMVKQFSDADQRAITKKQKEEDAFLKKQTAKWQELTNLDQMMIQKRINNAQTISKTQGETIQASNELTKLEGQTSLGDKSLGQSEDMLGEVRQARTKIGDNCDLDTEKSKNGAQVYKVPGGTH